MTREEILSMGAGREMDMAVAEAMGCSVLRGKYGNFLCGCPDERHGLCDRDSGFMAIIPDYSTEIGPAWWLVEELRKDWETAGCHSVWTMKDRKFTNEIHYVAAVTLDHLFEEAEADTAPLAICRVFLLAKMDGRL